MMIGVEKGVEYDYLYKIVLEGASGVGKSNIISKFVRKEFESNVRSTIGVEFASISKRFEKIRKVIKLQIWDIAGQERYRAITNAYYRGAVGVILVYDVTDPASFEQMENYIKTISTHCSLPIPACLVGNKCDKVRSISGIDYISPERGRGLAEKYGFSFVETSAFSGENIDFCFEMLSFHIYYTQNPLPEWDESLHFDFFFEFQETIQVWIALNYFYLKLPKEIARMIIGFLPKVDGRDRFPLFHGLEFHPHLSDSPLEQLSHP